MNLDKFFNAENIAIIGVSRDPNKIGHIILKNFIDGHFKGNVFIVNPNTSEILNRISYPSISSIKHEIDLAIIATPADTVLNIVKDCAKKGIKNIIIVSSGFKEIGNIKLEEELVKIIKKYNINMIGPNCLGTYDTYTDLDCLFLPRERMKRPKQGVLSFICQSGALGGVMLDLAAEENFGVSKFISYGNAATIDESDILEYLGQDKETKVICIYVEGIKDGIKFLNIAKKISKTKPIIAIKGGLTSAGSKAAFSHTGSLAGSGEIYLGAFKQANIIIAETLEEMFDYAKIFEKSIKPKGSRIQIITNGGGYGILTADAIVKNALALAELSKKTKSELKKKFPKIVIISNPMDLVGDADTKRYSDAIESSLQDKNIDIILLILLYQTPLITPDIVEVILKFNELKKKPIIVVSTGGEFTKNLNKSLEENVPCFTFPENAVRAIKKLVDYYKK